MLIAEIMAGRWPNASTPDGAVAANTHAAAMVLVVRRFFRRMVERWFGSVVLEEVIFGICARECCKIPILQKVKVLGILRATGSGFSFARATVVLRRNQYISTRGDESARLRGAALNGWNSGDWYSTLSEKPQEFRSRLKTVSHKMKSDDTVRVRK